MDNANEILSAVITATGKDSYAPETPGAVDADIYVGEDFVCGVTLIPDEQTQSRLVCAGNWCADEDALKVLGDRDQVIEEIERAVRLALGAYWQWLIEQCR